MKRMAKFFIAALFVSLSCTAAYAEKIYDTELVVVGAGTGGLTAAVYAAENGVKTILIEKLAGIGGQLMMIQGTFAVGSSLQQAENVYYDPNEVFKELMQYNHWFPNVKLVKKLVFRSGETIEWLISRGVKVDRVTAIEPNGKRVYHNYDGGHNPGKQFVGVMSGILKKSGATVMTETKGVSLITNKNGEVTGVMAENFDGEKVRINAKAVLIATGSIGQNKELLLKYNPDFPKNIRSFGLPQNMGDGIIMGQAAGAAVSNMDIMVWESAVTANVKTSDVLYNPLYLAANVALKNPGLFVNKDGERFVNEEYAGNFSVISNALITNGHSQYTIMDENTKLDIQNGKGAKIGYYTFFSPGQRMSNFDEMVKEGTEKGFAWKGDTIEEVAKKAGLDPKAVKASVDRYNELVKKGEDEDLGKTPRFMKETILKAPFYILKGDNTICDTAGGLKVNENSQVYHTSGKLIKGLYATGAAAGNKYGPSYSYILPGFAGAAAMNGGLIAVDHAAESLMNKKIR